MKRVRSSAGVVSGDVKDGGEAALKKTWWVLQPMV